MGKTIKTSRYTSFAIIVFTLFYTLSGCKKSNDSLPYWLIGSWEANVEGNPVKEIWYKKNNQYIGQTITYFDKYTQTEDIKLFIQNDSMYYNISLSNHKSCFICSDTKNDTLIFINVKNDFPKRIVYTKPRQNYMKAWIDNFPGDPNQMDYEFKKIAD